MPSPRCDGIHILCILTPLGAVHCLTVRLVLNLRDSVAADKTLSQRLFHHVLSHSLTLSKACTASITPAPQPVKGSTVDAAKLLIIPDVAKFFFQQPLGGIAMSTNANQGKGIDMDCFILVKSISDMYTMLTRPPNAVPTPLRKRRDATSRSGRRNH